MKTYSVKAKEILPQWHVVDAADQPLGRLAARVASLLRGKHRPDFTPHLDMRDFVVVVNAGKVRVTGNNKMRDKTYYRHTMYPGGLKKTTLERMMAAHPGRVIEHAVRGMLPHNRLGAQLYRHLKVYVGPAHPHQSQVKGSPGRVEVVAAAAPPPAKAEPVEEPPAAAAEEVVASKAVEQPDQTQPSEEEASS
jgi:large subunit ribosomal protein L13